MCGCSLDLSWKSSSVDFAKQSEKFGYIIAKKPASKITQNEAVKKPNGVADRRASAHQLRNGDRPGARSVGVI